MITQRSRYIAATITNVDATSAALPDRGNNVTIYTPPVIFEHAEYRRYQVKQGDTYPKIAFDQLGDSFRWFQIADMNPQIFYPNDLAAGTVIRVPVH